ncbi:haloacid dehalogenase type II [Alteromonas sp. A081]|uniref:haloacid dehalogenase type II n=1 Tax=Alteromonas sp. A081 TaxID=3410269 RepID=UPI003B9842B2
MIKALIFDVNETLLDIGAMKTGLAEILNSDETLVDLWFANLLHHSLVDIASSQFHDFIDIGAAALVMVANSKGIQLTQEHAKQTIKQHMTSLPPHDDVATTLEALKQRDVTLIALSNSSSAGLDAQLSYANIKSHFDIVLSVESIRTYKPHANVYHWACQQAAVVPQETMMIAAHGWDVSGAKAAGLNTVFVERPGKMMYPLGLVPDYSIDSLEKLLPLCLNA